jgi:mono/diheme cytochrome c family protein
MRRRYVVALSALSLAGVAQTQEHPQLARGRTVVQTICAACHSEQPPPRLAPPLSQVAMHYRQAVPDSARAIARITEWIEKPAANRSLLPPQAVSRWGLMPPLPIPEDQRRAAALYVWSLGAGKGAAGMAGHHHAMPPVGHE